MGVGVIGYVCKDSKTKANRQIFKAAKGGENRGKKTPFFIFPDTDGKILEDEQWSNGRYSVTLQLLQLVKIGNDGLIGRFE